MNLLLNSSEITHKRVLLAKMLRQKLLALRAHLRCVFKLVQLLEDLALNEERLDLDIKLYHQLVLGLLWRHFLEGLGLLLDLRKGLDGALTRAVGFQGVFD